MKQEATLIRARLKTPRATAIAGILFSVLLNICFIAFPFFLVRCLVWLVTYLMVEYWIRRST
jgi:hypothetical protein